jgi:hypothetical protein
MFEISILDVSTPLKKFYSKGGSTYRFAKLIEYLANSFPEDQFQKLKEFLLGKM